MIRVRLLVVAITAQVLAVTPASGQELTRYRGYALESSIASTVKIGGSRESDIKTLHERPSRIQELEWRAPYVRSQGTMVDPVRTLLLGFIDNQLYRIAVTYDPERTAGLTTKDVVDSISATYGSPVVASPRAARSLAASEVPADVRTVAQWEDVSSLLTLTQTSSYLPQFQLVLLSKALGASAQVAIKESSRLDKQEAPQRAIDQRKKDVDDALEATEKARVANRAAFKP